MGAGASRAILEENIDMESKGKAFRQLLRDEPYLFTGGIYSPLDAQIAESAGMKSIYLSGYSVAMLNGWPDMGLLTMTEVAKTASMVASAVDVPIIADADDGYGNALSTMRTVQEFVKTGVAGIHLEDQRFPKRCGHIAGKTVVSREEAIGKYRAALAEREQAPLVAKAEGAVRAEPVGCHDPVTGHHDGQRIGDEHGPNPSSSDDDQFRWLKQDQHVAVLHQITAEHGAEDNQNSDNGKHMDLALGSSDMKVSLASIGKEPSICSLYLVQMALSAGPRQSFSRCRAPAP